MEIKKFSLTKVDVDSFITMNQAVEIKGGRFAGTHYEFCDPNFTNEPICKTQ